MHGIRHCLALAALFSALPFAASAQSSQDGALGPLNHNASRDEASGTMTRSGEKHFYYFNVPAQSSGGLDYLVVLHQQVGVTDPLIGFRLWKKQPASGRLAARWVQVNTDFMAVPAEQDVIRWRDISTSDASKPVQQRISWRDYRALGSGTYSLEIFAPSRAINRKYSVGVDFAGTPVTTWRYTFNNRSGFSVTAPLPINCDGIDLPCY